MWIDEELRGIFKTTSEEHLQNLDSGLLHLEKHPEDQAVLEALMREAHSLKGDANMLGVREVGTLAHQLEHVLTQLQQQQIKFSQELGDRLALGLAAIRRLVHEAITGEPAAVDTFHVLAVLMGGQMHPLHSSEPAEQKNLPDSSLTHSAVKAADAQPHGPLSSEIPSSIDAAPLEATESLTDAAVLDRATVLTSPYFNPASTLENAFQPISNSAHGIETRANSGYRIETIRVTTQNLDSLMMQAGELTVTKIRIAHRLTEIEAIANLCEEWSRDLSGERSLMNRSLAGRSLVGRSLASRFLASRARQHNQTLLDQDTFRHLEAFRHRIEERLNQLSTQINTLQNALYEDTARLELISNELEEDVRTLRLMPLSTIFNLFPRMVRDLARQENKQVELVIEGKETRADKRILEEMKDPLMHVLRNAIDHGIELPSERERLGKPAVATIQLRSYQTPTSIVIEIQDDGRGLDLDRIKRIALNRGICREDELAGMTTSQIQSLIFMPGFSTAPLVTEVSGRGVGLDVVQTNVERLKGSIQVESTPGQGCFFRIQLAMTLATAHVLIALVNAVPYAIPVEYVQMLCLVEPEEIFTLEGRSTIIRQNQPVSVAQLADLLEVSTGSNSPLKSNQQNQLTCIMLQVGQESLGVFVDTVVDEQDVVIKPQSQLLRRVRNVSGATILGTGEVCMVLNPQDLIKSMRRQTEAIAPAPDRSATAKPVILLVEDSIAIRTQEKRMLEAVGYEVVTAVDGSDGWNKLQSRAFNAVISDVQMPNLDGLALTAKIRQEQKYDEMPIILITSLASDADKRRGAEAGANAYITKSSLNQELLLKTLQRLM
jgi:two-component system, chemotaxis family, sensor kinase CheA